MLDLGWQYVGWKGDWFQEKQTPSQQAAKTVIVILMTSKTLKDSVELRRTGGLANVLSGFDLQTVISSILT